MVKQNLRHTWQAWRDRWVKRYRKVPPAQVPENAPPTPPQESPTSKSRNSVSQNSWNIKATQSQVEESEESDGLDEILERVPKPKTTVDDDDDADAEGEDDDVSREAHPSGTQEGDLTQQGATQSQADPDARNFHLMNDAWEQIVERYGLGDIEEESNIPLLLASAPSILRIDQDQKTEAWSFYAQAVIPILGGLYVSADMSLEQGENRGRMGATLGERGLPLLPGPFGGV